MRRVGLGFLGTKLDAMGGFGAKRHKQWRPTVSFASDKSLKLDRLEIWHDRKFLNLATQVKVDIEELTAVEVTLRQFQIRDPWNFEEVYSYLYDFADQYKFDTEKEEYFVHLTTGTHVAQICLFLLTETRNIPGKFVQTSPKGEEGGGSLSIIDLDLSQYNKLAQRFERKLTKDLEILKAGINTKNAEFNRLITEIQLVARSSNEPMLLLGPTGAGKSHLAKQVYELKRVQHTLKGEFVDLNCATIRGDQAMSTQFGHAKGAFTGAATRRDGMLKRANGGLLFLDEIGELGLDEQAMLLRALEEKRFFPLGSDEEEESDFQLIAGTNRDLAQRVREGMFREDLLHRINTWCFSLPSLRERKEDIEPNLEFELRKFERRSGRRITFSAEGREAYLKFSLSDGATWPGNFRDLNASVVRMATLAPEGRITVEIADREIERLKSLWRGSIRDNFSAIGSPDEVLQSAGVLPSGVDEFDKRQLAEVIRIVKSCSSLAEAGRRLFSVSRGNRSSQNDTDRVRKYLSRFGVDAKRLVGGA